MEHMNVFFIYTDIKNKFYKIKKYYFNIFINKNHFEKQSQLQYQANSISIFIYKLTINLKIRGKC
jgi:hypothetical protein